VQQTVKDRLQALGRLIALSPGVLVFLVALIVILSALGFEHVGGYTPCPLCLQQRYAYYASIPLLALALALLQARRRAAAMLLFACVALAFLGNAGLATYHAGAEWKLWAGPESCSASAPLSTSAGNLLKNLAKSRVVRCDEPAVLPLGLSLAAWNVVASLLLSAGSAWAAVAAHRR
jgi:disulfide bond formation protein DsbB